MTTTPKLIEPQDIRPGDRICVAWSSGGIDRTHTLTVGEVDLESMLVKAAVSRVMVGLSGGATITLLERTEPERTAGSHWRDPETGAEYVIDIDGDALLVAGDRHHSLYLIGRADDDLARLVPLPAFDPATLWPPALRDDDWCDAADENTGNVCSRPAGHDGWVHAAYEAYEDRQELGPLLAIWGDPR